MNSTRIITTNAFDCVYHPSKSTPSFEMKLVEKDEDTGISINGVLYRSAADIPDELLPRPRMMHFVIDNISLP